MKNLEALMRDAAEFVRTDRPHWAVTYQTQSAVVDTDGDGKHDDGANPDTGEGSESGNLVITVNEHQFGEAALSGFESAREMADAMISIAESTAPSADED
jgi:hypothetical protein